MRRYVMSDIWSLGLEFGILHRVEELGPVRVSEPDPTRPSLASVVYQANQIFAWALTSSAKFSFFFSIPSPTSKRWN
jgi:hypothetical protein